MRSTWSCVVSTLLHLCFWGCASQLSRRVLELEPIDDDELPVLTGNSMVRIASAIASRSPYGVHLRKSSPITTGSRLPFVGLQRAIRIVPFLAATDWRLKPGRAVASRLPTGEQPRGFWLLAGSFHLIHLISVHVTANFAEGGRCTAAAMRPCRGLTAHPTARHTIPHHTQSPRSCPRHAVDAHAKPSATLLRSQRCRNPTPS